MPPRPNLKSWIRPCPVYLQNVLLQMLVRSFLNNMFWHLFIINIRGTQLTCNHLPSGATLKAVMDII